MGLDDLPIEIKLVIADFVIRSDLKGGNFYQSITSPLRFVSREWNHFIVESNKIILKEKYQFSGKELRSLDAKEINQLLRTAVDQGNVELTWLLIHYAEKKIDDKDIIHNLSLPLTHYTIIKKMTYKTINVVKTYYCNNPKQAIYDFTHNALWLLVATAKLNGQYDEKKHGFSLWNIMPFYIFAKNFIHPMAGKAIIDSYHLQSAKFKPLSILLNLSYLGYTHRKLIKEVVTEVQQVHTIENKNRLATFGLYESYLKRKNMSDTLEEDVEITKVFNPTCDI